MMVECELYTKQGEVVARIHVPPFNPMPEVLVWGSRTFIRETRDGHEEQYCEALSWTVVQHEPGEQTDGG